MSAPPQAPTREETLAEPQKTLEWISDRLLELYSFPTPANVKIDRAAYSHIYTAVWTFCNVTKDTRRSGPQGATAATSQELYLRLEEVVRGYCRGCLEHLSTTTTTIAGGGSQAVLESYLEQWTTFVRLSGVAKHLFQPLEDRWIRRVVAERAAAADDDDEDGKNSSHGQIYHVPELHMKVWREEVLKGGDARVRDALVVAMKQEGQNDDVLGEMLGSLKKVGLGFVDGGLVDLEE